MSARPTAAAPVPGRPPKPPRHQRVLLSCNTCRASKLKCDRGTPCNQCIKKNREDGCAYTIRPEKEKPSRNMASRLKRLEDMVKDMMHANAADTANAPAPVSAHEEHVPLKGLGHVVHAETTTTYIGATHFMAVLEDIEDLKSYFEDEEPPDRVPEDDFESPGSLMLLSQPLRTKDDLLASLPARQICDKLLMRYFSSHSPFLNAIHRPTFTRQYNEFWKKPMEAPIHWIALLLMTISLGVLYSSYIAPQELAQDSNIPPLDRFKYYRTAAGWALIRGRYNNPTIHTLPAMMLYIEAEFLLDRATQTNAYFLLAVLIRMMLRMGLHRDPSKLSHISAYEGEMRRRMWYMAMQSELLCAFHVGLPSMVVGIESDTTEPRNLLDDDFSEDCAELPISRPIVDWTPMSFTILKASLCRVFGLIVRHVNSLAPQRYADVMALDKTLEEAWAKVPAVMRVRPLEESVADPAGLIIQRFNLATMYQKSRCVLHRRYMSESRPPRPEHAYSRRACLRAALTILEYEEIIYHAVGGSGVLSQHGYFVTSLAVCDFMLAAMIVYVAVRSNSYSEFEGNYDFVSQHEQTPSKEAMVQVLRRSHSYFVVAAKDNAELSKVEFVLRTMVANIDKQSEGRRGSTGGVATAEKSMSPFTTEENDGANQAPADTTNQVASQAFVDGPEPVDWRAFLSSNEEDPFDQLQPWMMADPNYEMDLDAFSFGPRLSPPA